MNTFNPVTISHPIVYIFLPFLLVQSLMYCKIVISTLWMVNPQRCENVIWMSTHRPSTKCTRSKCRDKYMSKLRPFRIILWAVTLLLSDKLHFTLVIQISSSFVTSAWMSTDTQLWILIKHLSERMQLLYLYSSNILTPPNNQLYTNRSKTITHVFGGYVVT